MTDATIALYRFQNARAHDVVDLSDLGTLGEVDYRPRADQGNVTVQGARFADRLTLRDAVGWTIKGDVFIGGPNAGVTLMGGIGCSVLDSSFADTQSMAQLAVVDDVYFGKVTPPMHWTVARSGFVNQAVNGPPADADPTQCHQIYAHTTVDTAMNGLISGCRFERAPYGANVKLGGTHTWSGHARGNTIRESSFRQYDRMGTNILLVASSVANLVTNCDGSGANNPSRGVSVNGPASCHFENSPFNGIEVVTMSEKVVTVRYWFFGPRTFTYKHPFYSPHTELTSAPCGTDLEGLSWR